MAGIATGDRAAIVPFDRAAAFIANEGDSDTIHRDVGSTAANDFAPMGGRIAETNNVGHFDSSSGSFLVTSDIRSAKRCNSDTR